MRLTLESSQFKSEKKKKSGFICFSLFLNIMGFYFGILHLKNYLDFKT